MGQKDTFTVIATTGGESHTAIIRVGITL